MNALIPDPEHGVVQFFDSIEHLLHAVVELLHAVHELTCAVIEFAGILTELGCSLRQGPDTLIDRLRAVQILTDSICQRADAGLRCCSSFRKLLGPGIGRSDTVCVLFDALLELDISRIGRVDTVRDSLQSVPQVGYTVIESIIIVSERLQDTVQSDWTPALSWAAPAVRAVPPALS